MCIYIYMYALALKSTDSERDWFSHSDPAILFGGFNSQVIGDNHPFPGTEHWWFLYDNIITRAKRPTNHVYMSGGQNYLLDSQ